MLKILFNLLFKRTYKAYQEEIIKLALQIANLKEQNNLLINENKKLKGQIK